MRANAVLPRNGAGVLAAGVTRSTTAQDAHPPLAG